MNQILIPGIMDFLKSFQFIKAHFGTVLLLNEIVSPISNEYFRKLIAELNASKFISLNEPDFSQFISDTNHLKETIDVDSLIQEMLTPHKRKVVYIDFWGTWCVPCLQEMDHVPELKKKLDGEDVVFIYLANHSPEKEWAKVIQTKNLESSNSIHYNLPEEQQSMIERKLNVHAFPTYLLVNKDGEILSSKPPRPSQKQQLIKIIKDLIAL